MVKLSCSNFDVLSLLSKGLPHDACEFFLGIYARHVFRIPDDTDRYGEKYPGMVEELEGDLRDRRDRGIFLPSGVWCEFPDVCCHVE